jgi:putative SOS response-associated peptidase YedK
MCGRYGGRGDKQRIAEAFHVHAGLPDPNSDDPAFAETFDAAPGSLQPVVFAAHGPRELSLMRWGFKLPGRFLFNTRSEGVASAAFWRDKFAARCLVPASSYFEWQDCNTKPKPKFEIEIPGRKYFAIAALWAHWQDPKTGAWEPTFSTFTSAPNPLLAKIHSRQPVLLEPRDYDEWLAPSPRPPLRLLRVTPEAEMRVTLLNPPRPPAPEAAPAPTLFG